MKHYLCLEDVELIYDDKFEVFLKRKYKEVET